MDEFDFSHLLNDTPAPADGAARVRKTVTARRHHRQALGGTLGAFLVVAIGIGAIVHNSGPDTVVVQRDAGHTTITEAPATELTTTTTVDPRAAYVGTVHSGSVSGLPTGTSIVLSNDTGGPHKVGDSLLYWAQDKQGNMVWLETVTAYDAKTSAVTSKIAAVLNLPFMGTNETVCLGTCANARTGAELRNLVGITDDATVRLAWTVDTKSKTFTATSNANLSPYAVETTTTLPAPADPPRPALYGAIATCKAEDCVWYTEHEQATAGGGGGPNATQFVVNIIDNKANKYAVVWSQGNTVYDTLVVDMSIGQPLAASSAYKYKGQAGVALLVIESDGKPTNAWRLDTGTHKIVSVDLNDVTPNK